MLTVKKSEEKQTITNVYTDLVSDLFKSIKEYSKTKVGINNNLDYLVYYLLVNERNILTTLFTCINKKLTMADFRRMLDMKKLKLISNIYNKEIDDKLIDYIKIKSRGEVYCKDYDNIIKIGENKELINSNIIDLKEYYSNEIFCLDEKLLARYIKKFERFNKLILPIGCGFNNNIRSENIGFYSFFFENMYLYEVLFNVLKQEIRTEEITVIIPEVMCYEDYLFWYMTIKTYLGNHVKVGIIINSINDLYEFDSFEKVESCLIDLDEIMRKNSVEISSYENFNLKIVPKLRDIKAHLNEENIIPTIVVKEEINEEIINKCLKMGFCKFNNSRKNMETIKKSIKNYIKRRIKHKKTTK